MSYLDDLHRRLRDATTRLDHATKALAEHDRNAPVNLSTPHRNSRNRLFGHVLIASLEVDCAAHQITIVNLKAKLDEANAEIARLKEEKR